MSKKERKKITPEQERQIKQEFDKISAALIPASPFISSILRKVRVIITYSVPTAGISERGILVINPEFWLSLDFKAQAWLLAHEAMHVSFKDQRRQGDRNDRAWNITADAVNNQILDDMIVMPPSLKEIGVTIEKLYREKSNVFSKAGYGMYDLGKVAKEELFDLIPWKMIKFPVMMDLLNGDQYNDCGDPMQTGEDGDIILRNGDDEAYSDDPEASDERWTEIVAESYMSAKQAGNVPAGLERAINKILDPKVPWQQILRQMMQKGLGRTIVNTWRRPSRKMIKETLKRTNPS